MEDLEYACDNQNFDLIWAYEDAQCYYEHRPFVLKHVQYFKHFGWTSVFIGVKG